MTDGRAPVQGSMFGTASRAKGAVIMTQHFQRFVGIDWGSERHRVCVIDPSGAIIDRRWAEHSGSSLSELTGWLRQSFPGAAGDIAVAIELPRGPVVEALME